MTQKYILEFRDTHQKVGVYGKEEAVDVLKSYRDKFGVDLIMYPEEPKKKTIDIQKCINCQGFPCDAMIIEHLTFGEAQKRCGIWDNGYSTCSSCGFTLTKGKCEACEQHIEQPKPQMCECCGLYVAMEDDFICQFCLEKMFEAMERE